MCASRIIPKDSDLGILTDMIYTVECKKHSIPTDNKNMVLHLWIPYYLSCLKLEKYFWFNIYNILLWFVFRCPRKKETKQEKRYLTFKIFTFRVSGRGYKNGAACLSVCVCVSVCEHSRNWMDWRTITKFDLIKSQTSSMVRVEGQGHQVKKRDVYDFLTSVPVYKMLAYGATL